MPWLSALCRCISVCQITLQVGQTGLSGREVYSAHAALSNLTLHLQVKALQSDQPALLAIAMVSAHLDTFFCFFETLFGFLQPVQLTLGIFVWLLPLSVLEHSFCRLRKHSHYVGAIPVGSMIHVLFVDICSYFPDNFQGTSGIMCPAATSTAATSTGVGSCPDVPAGRCTPASTSESWCPAFVH